MMTMWRVPALTALAALTLGGGSAAAQTTGPAHDAEREAAILEEQALEAVEDGLDWGRAASLFRQAAELRADDPVSAKHYHRAGLMAYYDGQEGRAVEYLQQAGEAALRWGDVRSASSLFIDAAWVAQRDGDDRRAHDLAGRARRLAQSPLLPTRDRADLLNRITGEEEFALAGS